jgi:hypothetical protein
MYHLLVQINIEASPFHRETGRQLSAISAGWGHQRHVQAAIRANRQQDHGSL